MEAGLMEIYPVHK